MQISTLFWIVVFWISCKPTLLSFRWPCKNSQLCTRPTLWSKFTVTWLLSRRGGCMMCLFAKLRLHHNPSWFSPETSRRFGIRGCWNFWTNAGSICRCVWCFHTFEHSEKPQPDIMCICEHYKWSQSSKWDPQTIFSHWTVLQCCVKVKNLR